MRSILIFDQFQFVLQWGSSPSPPTTSLSSSASSSGNGNFSEGFAAALAAPASASPTAAGGGGRRLDFGKIKRDLALAEAPRKKLLLLQALRWASVLFFYFLKSKRILFF